jgi:TonB family protein
MDWPRERHSMKAASLDLGLVAMPLLLAALGTVCFAGLPHMVHATEGNIPYVVIVKRVSPAIPPGARARGFGGRVFVWATVDTAGVPQQVHVRTPGLADIDSIAVAAARQWRFAPPRDPRTHRLRSMQIGIGVEFRHPFSPNLVQPKDRVLSASATVHDALGRSQTINLRLSVSARLDSIASSYRYEYLIENRRSSTAALYYFGLLPVGPEYPAEDYARLLDTLGTWALFTGCDGQEDARVIGWMVKAVRDSEDSRAHGLRPGKTLRGIYIVSSKPPGMLTWIADGGLGCDLRCFPWSDTCSTHASLKGRCIGPVARSDPPQGESAP